MGEAEAQLGDFPMIVRKIEWVPALVPLFSMPASPSSSFPPVTTLLPITVQVHLGITPEGQDQAQGAAVGADRRQESHCSSALTALPQPSSPDSYLLSGKSTPRRMVS